MEQAIISGVTHDTTEAKVTITGLPDSPGVAADLFNRLAQREVNVDMIVQNVSTRGIADISFTMPKDDLVATSEVVQQLVDGSGGDSQFSIDDEIARVSLVGAGMKSHPGVAAKMFQTLADLGINIEMISTSTIRISCVVRDSQIEKAVQGLHSAFDLA